MHISKKHVYQYNTCSHKWIICHFLTAAGVMSVEWSSSSEWVLVTGGCDGAIRFWDIRRAGCFLVLDQSQSQIGRRPPILERSAANKVLILFCFFCSPKQSFLVLFPMLLNHVILLALFFGTVWNLFY